VVTPTSGVTAWGEETDFSYSPHSESSRSLLDLEVRVVGDVGGEDEAAVSAEQRTKAAMATVIIPFIMVSLRCRRFPSQPTWTNLLAGVEKNLRGRSGSERPIFLRKSADFEGV
jgi:hypothetical protein